MKICTYLISLFSSPRSIGTVICIDALNFGDPAINPGEQYEEDKVKRELDKAYAGFSTVKESVIVSGYWGCGNYKVRITGLLIFFEAGI